MKTLNPIAQADNQAAANSPDTNQPGRRRLLTVTMTIILALLSTACMPGVGGGSLDSQSVDLGTVAAANDGQTGDTNASFGAADDYSASATRAIVVVDQVDVYDGPDGSLIGTMSSTTEYGTTRVLLAESTEANWVKVRLPMRPNHTTAWVSADDVQLEHVEPSVEINLAERTLTVRSQGSIVAQTTVAVGSEEYPTPRGTFYITDKLETPEPNGVYGPYALGLSGYSETLSEFGGGDGQIGIHGTNDPGSLGQAVSHGCIRLPNDVVTMLAGVLPLGTPVHVV